MYKTLSETLDSYRTMVQNAASDSEIKTRLLSFGYDDQLLQKGIDLYNVTNELFLKQKSEYKEQYEASADFIESREKAEKEFTHLYKIAKVVFRSNTDLQKSLPASTALTPHKTWRKTAESFYVNLKNKPEALEVLSRFKIDAETIQSRIEDIKTLEHKENSYDKEKGQAQQATKDRDKLFEELKDYCYELRELSRIAFEDRPQILEKLGVLVRS